MKRKSTFSDKAPGTKKQRTLTFRPMTDPHRFGPGLIPKSSQRVRELKVLNGGYVQASSNTGTITALGPPSQGDTAISRDGDRIIWAGIKGFASCICADTTNVCRLTIVQSLVDNAVDPPVAATIYQDATNCAYSPFNDSAPAKYKYKVLWDHRWVVSVNGPAALGAAIDIPAASMRPVYFNAAATTGKGIIYFCFSSDSSVVTHPTVVANFNYPFYDV